jgi:DNA-directed RNA polymerase subunit RPC12/RpoP
MPTILLAEYLDEAEATMLGEKLRVANVAVTIKRHGLPRFFGVEVNYKVIIEAEDFDKAQPVFKQFLDDLQKIKKEQVLLHTSQCPYCSSKDIVKKEKKDIWQRFRFYGVAVWRCNECGGGWYL